MVVVLYPRERILDLSSGSQHWPVTSNINPVKSHTTFASESATGLGSGSGSGSGTGLRLASHSERSNTPNGTSFSLSFNSGAYKLPDATEQIATPVINQLMSRQSSPKFKIFKSPRLVGSPPTPSVHAVESISGPSSIQLAPTQSRRRKTINRRTSSGEDDIMSRFSQWDRYRDSTGNAGAPQSLGSRVVLRRTVSIKRNGFTTRRELEQFNKNKKFLFHKGFFKRNRSTRSSNKGFLRNQADLNAVLNFIDLPSIGSRGAIPIDTTTVYQPTCLMKRYPQIVEAFKIPLREYVMEVSRNSSKKKTSQQPPVVPVLKYRSSRVGTNIKRSNTTPGPIQNIRRSSYSPESQLIHELWKEYIRLVIFQRIQLRISLSNTDHCNNSRENSNLSLPLQESQASYDLSSSSFSRSSKSAVQEKQKRYSRIYSIPNQDRYDSTTSLRTTASSSTLSAKRKAY